MGEMAAGCAACGERLRGATGRVGTRLRLRRCIYVFAICAPVGVRA